MRTHRHWNMGCNSRKRGTVLCGTAQVAEYRRGVTDGAILATLGEGKEVSLPQNEASLEVSKQRNMNGVGCLRQYIWRTWTPPYLKRATPIHLFHSGKAHFLFWLNHRSWVPGRLQPRILPNTNKPSGTRLSIFPRKPTTTYTYPFLPSSVPDEELMKLISTRHSFGHKRCPEKENQHLHVTRCPYNLHKGSWFRQVNLASARPHKLPPGATKRKEGLLESYHPPLPPNSTFSVSPAEGLG